MLALATFVEVGLALGQLIVVVREGQIYAPGMDIHLLTELIRGHD